MNLNLNFSYTRAQLKVFDDKNPRFITVAKGRRLDLLGVVLNMSLKI